MDSSGWPYRKVNQEVFDKCRLGKTIVSEILWTYQVGILGHVQKLRMVIVPRECPGLIGLDDTASWTLVRNFPEGQY